MQIPRGWTDGRRFQTHSEESLSSTAIKKFGSLTSDLRLLTSYSSFHVYPVKCAFGSYFTGAPCSNIPSFQPLALPPTLSAALLQPQPSSRCPLPTLLDNRYQVQNFRALSYALHTRVETSRQLFQSSICYK